MTAFANNASWSLSIRHERRCKVYLPSRLRRARSLHSQPGDFVFSAADGSRLHYRAAVFRFARFAADSSTRTTGASDHPFAGYDLVEITRADVNRNFTKLTVVATSDEPGAVLTAFTAGVRARSAHAQGRPLPRLFDLNGTPINNVEVHRSLGDCAQRAVPLRKQLDALLISRIGGAAHTAPPADCGGFSA